MSKILVFLIGFILLIFIPTHNAHAAPFSVCTLGELTSAITNANSNGEADTINFNCSTTLTFTSEFVILNDGAGNGITINSNGNTVIFDETGDDNWFFTVNGGASLELNGFTLRNGNGVNGGAIFNSGTVTINNSIFTDNSVTTSGGAILNSGALTINNSTFTDNSADDGGAIYNSGTLTINNSTFTDNSAQFAGGAIRNSGTVSISDGTFIDNQTPRDGGAIFNDFGTVSISGSTFTNNSAQFAGGAIFNIDTLTITNSTFTGNSADDGGAIFNSGSVTISSSTFAGNLANLTGGAIFNNGTVSISTSTFTNNSTGENGGAIANFSIANSQDTHYSGDATNNTCFATTITDNGGNTRINSAGCPGTAPIPLDVSALACNGDNAEFTINAGDGDFTVDGTSGNFPPSPVPVGLVTLTGPATWTDVTVTERRGERQSVPLGGITCPSGVIIPPTILPAPIVTVLGCALDSADGLDIFNAPDNTYCRVLMRNGNVVSYSGAIPADLIGLGVILAVDVYRLEGGRSINTFPDYARVCLAGAGRLFYMDSRNAPRVAIELATETEGNLTCGWIPAPGTLILTN